MTHTTARLRFPWFRAFYSLCVICLMGIGVTFIPSVVCAMEFTGVTVGTAGVWKPGVRTPVTLTTSDVPAGAILRLTVPDGDGVPVRYTTTIQENRASLTVQFGRISTPIFAELLQENVVTAQRWFEPGESVWAIPSNESTTDRAPNDALPTDDTATNDTATTASARSSESIVGYTEGTPAATPIWFIISRDPIAIESAYHGFRLPSGQRPKLVPLQSFAELPSDLASWEAFERLIVAADQADEIPEIAPDAPQITALTEWVRMGGRVVLSLGGSASQKWTAQNGPLAAFAPGASEKIVLLRETTELENLLTAPIAIPRTNGRIEFSVPGFTALREDAKILVHHGTLPLIYRWAQGFGEVTFAGISLSHPAIHAWEGRGGLIASLLELPIAAVTDQSESGGTLIHQGFDDHSGQLRGSLDQFAGVQVPPFWSFVLLCIALILLVGPIDYFIGCRLLKRPGLIGLCVVCVAVCVAVPLTLPRLRGERLRLNQVELIDVDGESGQVRGNLWADFFSPTTTRLDLTFDSSNSRKLVGIPETNPMELQVGWFGLPGTSLGGLDVQGGRWDQTTVSYDAIAAPPISERSYHENPLDGVPPTESIISRLSGVPIATGATKHITARWNATTAPAQFSTLQYSDSDRTLVGTLRNPLPVTMDHVLLVYENQVWRFGNWAPDEEVTLTPTTQRIDRRQCFVRPQLTGQDERIGGTRYDIMNTSPDYALQSMLFHESLGGYDFTQLGNGFRNGIDGSGSLSAGRAILIGAVPPESQTKIRTDEIELPTQSQDQRQLFVRWFLKIDTK